MNVDKNDSLPLKLGIVYDIIYIVADECHIAVLRNLQSVFAAGKAQTCVNFFRKRDHYHG